MSEPADEATYVALETSVARLDERAAFQDLARSRRTSGDAHDAEVAHGRARQDEVRRVVAFLARTSGGEPMTLKTLRAGFGTVDRIYDAELTSAERKIIETLLRDTAESSARK